MHDRGPTTIQYANGSTLDCDDYAEAVRAIKTQYPLVSIGHDGDLEDGGERTFCWSDTGASIDDDGSNAIASITFQKQEFSARLSIEVEGIADQRISDSELSDVLQKMFVGGDQRNNVLLTEFNCSHPTIEVQSMTGCVQNSFWE